MILIRVVLLTPPLAPCVARQQKYQKPREINIISKVLVPRVEIQVQPPSYACQLSNHHSTSITSIHHTSMHFKFKDLCKCKQAQEYAHLKCNQSKFTSLLPLLVCFSCLRILIFLHCLMLLPLYPCPCPTSTSLSQSFPKLSYLCTISPPLSSISIKDVLLIDTEDCIGVDV